MATTSLTFSTTPTHHHGGSEGACPLKVRGRPTPLHLTKLGQKEGATQKSAWRPAYGTKINAARHAKQGAARGMRTNQTTSECSPMIGAGIISMRRTCNGARRKIDLNPEQNVDRTDAPEKDRNGHENRGDSI